MVAEAAEAEVAVVEAEVAEAEAAGWRRRRWWRRRRRRRWWRMVAEAEAEVAEAEAEAVAAARRRIGNLKLPTCVFHCPPVVCMCSLVYQNVQSSMGSIAIIE